MEQQLDNAPCGYVRFNDNAVILDVNQTLCSMLGYTRGELEGNKFDALLAIAGKIFFQTHLFPMLKLQSGVDEIFLSLRQKNGELLPVILSGKCEGEAAGRICICVLMPVHNRRKYEDEILEAKRQAEQALRDNAALKAATEAADKQAMELDRQLYRISQMNDELMQFNNIIHHDMQECIRKIVTFSKLGQMETEENYLGKISETANKLKAINSSLSTFIRLGVLTSCNEKVNLNDALLDAKAKILESTGFSGLQLSAELLPAIQGSNEQIRLLFYHLLSNSIRYRRGDAVNVVVSSVTFENNVYRNINRYSYREVVKLNFTDDGQGFDNTHKEQVFAILKKLSAENTASGVGLAICKKIINNHHGEIEINSTIGVGTTVSVLLPLHHTVETESEKEEAELLVPPPLDYSN
jgi:sigma-B regulation protein RsbU (phosphoserine phosphatase)